MRHDNTSSCVALCCDMWLAMSPTPVANRHRRLHLTRRSKIPRTHGCPRMHSTISLSFSCLLGPNHSAELNINSAHRSRLTPGTGLLNTLHIAMTTVLTVSHTLEPPQLHCVCGVAAMRSHRCDRLVDCIRLPVGLALAAVVSQHPSHPHSSSDKKCSCQYLIRFSRRRRLPR